jgi:hypothetical protein
LIGNIEKAQEVSENKERKREESQMKKIKMTFNVFFSRYTNKRLQQHHISGNKEKAKE